MSEYQNDRDLILEAMEADEAPKKKRRLKKDSAETLDKLVRAIDGDLGEAYTYTNAELYSQMAEAWDRYYRNPYGNEEDGFSDWVSPMVTKHVNQAVAFLTDQYHRNSSPIIKFRPKSGDDVAAAEMADEYVNYIFRQHLNGNKIIQETAFNAALLKVCPVRVYMKTESTQEELTYSYEGSPEGFEQDIAIFMAGNPFLAEVEPDFSSEDFDEDKTMVEYRWLLPEVVSKKPQIDVVSPGSFFVSRQAENEKDARIVATMNHTTISDLKTMYPNAPELNGYKSKKDKEQFWVELNGDHQDWYQEIEWIARWSYDTLGYNQEEEILGDSSAGLGAKKVFVVDAEIYFDAEDTGYADLYHVVKCGNKILHKEMIAQRSYIWGTLIPQAGKWTGLSLCDLVQQDAREETANQRAFTDATVQAAHANPIFDPDIIEEDDVYNRGPDTPIRYKRDSIDKGGRPAIEWTKSPGPDQSILTAIQAMQSGATSLTGVGANFQGATMDEASDMRMSTETAKIIDNNSSLMLNYFARNYSNFLCRVLVAILDVAVKGGASPEMLEIRSNWVEAHPKMFGARSNYYLNADIGVNDAQEKTNKATAIMQLLASASGGGGQDANGNPIPTIPVQLTDTAGYQAAKLMLESQGVVNVDEYVLNPNIPPEQVQMQSIMTKLEAALQQIPAMVEQGVQQSIEMAKQDAAAQKDLSVAEMNRATAEKTLNDVEKSAFDAAEAIEAEERREDAEAWKEAASMEANEIADEKWKAEIDFKYAELEQAKKIAEKAEESKASTVYSP